MRNVKTTKGASFVIAPLAPSEMAAASANLVRLGIHTGKNPDVHENIPFASELCRLLIQDWTKPDGTRPLEGLKPAEARALIAKTPHLIDFVLREAKVAADEDGEEYGVDAGN